MLIRKCEKTDKWLAYSFETTFKMDWQSCVYDALTLGAQLNDVKVSIVRPPEQSLSQVKLKKLQDILSLPESAVIEVSGNCKEFSDETIWIRFVNQTYLVQLFIKEEYVNGLKNDRGELLSEEEKLHVFDKFMDAVEIHGHGQLKLFKTADSTTKDLLEKLCAIKDFSKDHIYWTGTGLKYNFTNICEKIAANYAGYITESQEVKQKLDEILKTLPKQPVFRITYSDKHHDYTNSKLGGSFYWPNDNVPVLLFLAQINFEELPENDVFPKSGLLQFFIGSDDDLGLFDDRYKVVFHKEIIKNSKNEHQNLECESNPVTDEAKIEFTLDEETISFGDYRFERYKERFKHIPEDVLYACKELCGDGSKLLGYPFFTQGDVRFEREDKPEEFDTLLFQLDSNDGHMVWGDAGVANFFINSEALKNHDFSDVLYTWDCY